MTIHKAGKPLFEHTPVLDNNLNTNAVMTLVTMITIKTEITDDIYIMVKCLCVCNENAYFRIQKIWSFLMFIATFHTQRNWPFLLFPGTFRTQRIWSFPCFLRLLCSKDLVISHVYRHFPNSKASRNSETTKSKSIQRIWSNLLFLDTSKRSVGAPC